MTNTNKLLADFNRYFTSGNDVDVPERVSVPRDEWRELHAALAQSGQGAAEVSDTERIDWLCQQYVTVRIPLRYGSEECFIGSPDDNDGESVPWDIRAAIDKARAALKPKAGGVA